jgi:hypothetical protein
MGVGTPCPRICQYGIFAAYKHDQHADADARLVHVAAAGGTDGTIWATCTHTPH